MSITDWKEREKLQRKEEIIDAAERLFFGHKFEEVSMDHIAKEVGLAKGTLYLYFRDKESLFCAVTLRGMRLLNEMHVRCSRLDSTSIEKVRALTQGYYLFTQDHPDYFVLLCQVTLTPYLAKDNEYGREIIELTSNNIMIASDIFKEGMAEGTIRRDIDPREMTIFLSLIGNTILGMAPVWRTVLESIGTEKDQIWKHYLRFISPAIVPSSGLHLFDTGQNVNGEYEGQ